MNDLINKYRRISAILSSLNVDYRESNCYDGNNPAKNVALLSEELRVPREQLRQDLMFLMASPIFRTCIHSGGEGDSDDSDFISSDALLDLFDRQAEGWDTLPVAFHFNDIYSRDELTSDTRLPIYMSETERELFYHYVPGFEKENWNTLLFKYPPFSQINPETHSDRKDAAIASMKNKQISSNLEEIATAILINRSISFVYQNKPTSLQQITIRPLKILESLDKGLIYIVSTPDGKNITFHRIDRIRGSVSIMKKAKKKNPEAARPEPDAAAMEALLQRFDYIWDADAAYDQEPFDVRIRIKANTRNILNKIKNETSRRKYARLTRSETESGIWYYTDKVIGFNSFRRWVFQYGASMTVLEPRELADSICQSALWKLEFYEKGRFER